MGHVLENVIAFNSNNLFAWEYRSRARTMRKEVDAEGMDGRVIREGTHSSPTDRKGNYCLLLSKQDEIGEFKSFVVKLRFHHRRVDLI